MSAQKINDGGPAFPSPELRGVYTEFGMTLRDYFAAKAMAVMYADPGTVTDWRSDAWEVKSFSEYVAETAYEMADAMLKARSQP